VGEDAGRNAYLAAFHAAQALIAERTGKDAKTTLGTTGNATRVKYLLFERVTRNASETAAGPELKEIDMRSLSLFFVVGLIAGAALAWNGKRDVLRIAPGDNRQCFT
jgi:hypothetical protein